MRHHPLAPSFRIPAGPECHAGSGLSDLANDWLCPHEDEFADMLKESGFDPVFW